MAKDKEVSFIVDAKNKAKGPLLEVKRDFENVEKSASKSLREMSTSLRKADSSIYKFSNRLNGLDRIAKRSFQGASGAAALYTATTLRDFSQLNDGISKTNTLYQQTKQSQDKMFRDAININKLIPADYTTITQGFYDSISSGADPKYASMTTRKFGIASVGGDTDIPVVTKAAMGTMNAFGKEIKDLDHILDVQFSTVKNGIVEYEQLASSLETGVLKSADNAGVSIEELYGSIAGITKNSIPANVAATSLVQLFNKFTDAKAIKGFKEFGVDIQDTAGHTRKLTGIFKDLNEQFEKRGMTKEQRAGFLKNILGSDEAVRALQPLLGDLKEFDRILGEMNNSDGAVMDAYGDRLESMGTQLKLLWNNFKIYGMESIYALSPLLNALMEPTIKKQKFTVQKMNLEDKLEFEDDPTNKAMIKKSIALLETQIKDIDLTPVEKFRDGLKEGVEQLEKINPPLAKFFDSIGSFLLNYVGDDENAVTYRENAKLVGKGIVGGYAFKKVIDAIAWFNTNFGNKKGEKTGESLASTIKTMNINANIVNVYGNSVNSKGNNFNPKPSNVMPSPGGSLTPVLTGMAGLKLGETAIKQMMLNTPKVGQLLLEGTTGKATGTIITEAMKEGAISLAEVGIGGTAITTALSAAGPLIAAGAFTLVMSALEKKINPEGKNPIIDSKTAARENMRGKELADSISAYLSIHPKPQTVKSYKPNYYNKKDTIIKRDISSQKIKEDISNMFKKDLLLNTSLNTTNTINVPKPTLNANIYIDGSKLAPKRTEITYENIGKQVERNSRRYSGTTR
ncbi:phage tail tape measure protein [Tepidibacter hydrothermalis]|uniref:Phage tail tape measure protein n=1 Tax=Tepidibacter hydrothermalis TaxID=3036126 RepID=A0ABY8EKE4_9FIRM|nr:phage tail tape measure protein [Tepidibacter hydrothermalis]WFD12454.1 phage tail tape measure protein [Tepidibacter hydrothermalis]